MRDVINGQHQKYGFTNDVIKREAFVKVSGEFLAVQDQSKLYFSIWKSLFESMDKVKATFKKFAKQCLETSLNDNPVKSLVLRLN